MSACVQQHSLVLYNILIALQNSTVNYNLRAMIAWLPFQRGMLNIYMCVACTFSCKVFVCEKRCTGVCVKSVRESEAGVKKKEDLWIAEEGSC
jgi:hypothetical protein